MRLLLTGASGQLGSYLLQQCRRRGLPVVAWSGQQEGELFGYLLRPLDIAEPNALARAFHDAHPDGIRRTAALAAIADCPRHPDRAEGINTRGSAVLAELADRANIPLVHVSTDLVFDGQHAPDGEADFGWTTLSQVFPALAQDSR